MALLAFILGSFMAFIMLVVFMITSYAKAESKKSEYVNLTNQIGNTAIFGINPNVCEVKSLQIQNEINELVMTLYPTCSWVYHGNKMDLPFMDFIDLEILTQDGEHLITERIARNGNHVTHCDAL